MFLLVTHCAVALFLGATLASAKPLDDVLNSDLMRDFKDQGEDLISKQNLNSQLSRGSNIRLIFSGKSGTLQLNVWVAPNDKSFLPRKQSTNRSKEFVMAERIFTRADGLSVTIQTYVAHPHYTNIADLGLLPDFAALRPPALQSDFSLPATIQGIESVAYRTKVGGLLVTIPVEKGTIIALSSARWEDLSSVLDLAAKLDIPRLRTKLKS